MIWPFNKPKRDLHEELAAAVSANAELARQLAEACRERDEYRESAAMWKRTASRRGAVLSIIGQTVSRNGTALKLARMAREGTE